MGTLFGALAIEDSERPFTSVEGRQVIWDMTQLTFEQWSRDVDDATRLFVQGTTTNHQERYELAGGGTLEEESFTGAMTGDVNRGGSWDAAYPLWQFGKSLAYDEVTLAYLTMGTYEAAIQTILNMNNSTVFSRLLRAMFRATTTAYTDKIFGSLTLQPLANGDSVVYPPLVGVTTEATENLYLAPNYTEATISDTNDPILAIRNKIEPHYGLRQGGSPILVLVNTTAVPYLSALTAFSDLPFYNVRPGDNTAIPENVDPSRIPSGGRIVGVAWGCTIIEWPRMPSGWMIAIHQDAPAPLKKRIDPPAMGLAPGLALASKDEMYPFIESHWRNRFGYAVGNRLGGVVVALNGTASYTAPTLYA